MLAKLWLCPDSRTRVGVPAFCFFCITLSLSRRKLAPNSLLCGRTRRPARSALCCISKNLPICSLRPVNPATQGLTLGTQKPSANLNEEKVKIHLIPGCSPQQEFRPPQLTWNVTPQILFEVAHTFVLHLEFPGEEEQFCHMGGHTPPSSCKSKTSTQSWLQAPLQQARSLDTLLAPKIVLRKPLKNIILISK